MAGEYWGTMAMHGRVSFSGVAMKKLNPTALFPTRGTDGSAGIDFYSTEEVVLQPNSLPVAVPLGLQLSLPEGTYFELLPRSGNTLNGVIVTPGVIDQDYQGEISCLVHKVGSQPIVLPKDTKICQGVLRQHIPIKNFQVCDFNDEWREGFFNVVQDRFRFFRVQTKDSAIVTVTKNLLESVISAASGKPEHTVAQLVWDQLVGQRSKKDLRLEEHYFSIKNQQKYKKIKLNGEEDNIVYEYEKAIDHI